MADVSAAAVLRARYPRTAANLNRYGGAPGRGLDQAGRLASFTRISVGEIWWALRRYRTETLRLIAQVGMGTGAIAVVGGTAAIMGFVTVAGGSLIAIQGFASLGNIGIESFTGFFAALVNVRAAAPVIAGIALAATVGAGATAELGAMRISEEIDALEVMGIKSISFLASTRILAGLIVIMPLYALGLIMSFAAPQVVTTVFYGQSNGTYEHYFRTFLRPEDLAWSGVEAVIIAAIVMITHCYYGYTAGGGPVGVGNAVGRSMRVSLVSVPLVVLLAALALYGVDPNFALTV
jgi:phospholipid/cholesterol/gamma-HCH transport system permease protein